VPTQNIQPSTSSSSEHHIGSMLTSNHLFDSQDLPTVRQFVKRARVSEHWKLKSLSMWVCVLLQSLLLVFKSRSWPCLLNNCPEVACLTMLSLTKLCTFSTKSFNSEVLFSHRATQLHGYILFSFNKKYCKSIIW